MTAGFVGWRSGVCGEGVGGVCCVLCGWRSGECGEGVGGVCCVGGGVECVVREWVVCVVWVAEWSVW